MEAGAGQRAGRCTAGSRTQEASLCAGSLCLSGKYRSQAGEYLRTGEPAAESKGSKFARRNGCGKAAQWKSPKSGLSHCAWKSRKRRGIPTFPQPPRRAFGYIFYVSIATLKVTFSNVLTRFVAIPRRNACQPFHFRPNTLHRCTHLCAPHVVRIVGGRAAIPMKISPIPPVSMRVEGRRM